MRRHLLWLVPLSMLVALAAAQTSLRSMLGGYLLGKETSSAHGNQVAAFVFIDLGEVKDGEALPVVAGETAAHEVGLRHSKTNILTAQPYSPTFLQSPLFAKFALGHLWPGELAAIPRRSQPVGATPSDMNSFSKGGVYGTRKTGQAFGGAEDRHVAPLESGRVVA